MTRGAKEGSCLVVTPGTPPGRRPHCPHCGGYRVQIVNPSASSRDGAIRAQAMRCNAESCGREFWQFANPEITQRYAR